jgi:arginase
MIRNISLIGLPTDINSSFERGASGAPAAIRAALWSARGNMACENGMEVGMDFQLDDLGDLLLTEDTKSDDLLIQASLAKILSSGGIPICLGGDHAVTFPILQAVAAHHGRVNILHFDAHPDLYRFSVCPDYGGGPSEASDANRHPHTNPALP